MTNGKDEGATGPLAGNGEPGLLNDGEKGRPGAGRFLNPSAPQADSAERSKGKVGRQEAAKAALTAAIRQDLQANPPDRSYDAGARAFNLMQELDSSTRAHVLLGVIASMYQQRGDQIVRKKLESEPRQGWLSLPEYAHVPQVLKVEAGFVPTDDASPEQYAESLEEAEARLRAWLLPRVSAENLKLQRQKIREMKKARRGAALQYAGAPEMSIGQAMALHLANLESPRAKRDRKGGKARQRLQRRINDLG
jgi:hypothetical protein